MINCSKEDFPMITAVPRVALRDEKILIKLDNFPRNVKITLHGQHILGRKRKITLASCGHYVSDEHGQVRVAEQPSTGGTYTGLEPMGLIWSLQRLHGQARHTRIRSNSSDGPRVIHLKTYLGHLQLEDIYYDDDSFTGLESLASVELERWLWFPSEITRLEVNAGNVRGSLFLPHGEGPFRGVIDVDGSGGGNVEFRAALLSSHGFATLSLAFFGYQDLPKELSDVSFDYFEEAAEWLSTHPKVIPHGIGVVALSKGVEFAYCMSAYLRQVKCLVAIAGLPWLRENDLYHKGNILHRGSLFSLDRCEITDYGEHIFKTQMTNDHDVIPAWRGDAKHLILVPEDDHTADPESYKLLLKSCPEEKKDNFEVVRYPNAGHCLEPPYNPACKSGFHPYFDVWMYYGGQMKEQAAAQEDSWQRLLNHLRKHIPTL